MGVRLPCTMGCQIVLRAPESQQHDQCAHGGQGAEDVRELRAQRVRDEELGARKSDSADRRRGENSSIP